MVEGGAEMGAEGGAEGASDGENEGAVDEEDENGIVSSVRLNKSTCIHSKQGFIFSTQKEVFGFR